MFAGRGFTVGCVFRETFPEGRLYPLLSHFLLSPHHHLSGTQTDKTHDSPQMGQSWFPTCCGGARPREKEQLLSSCSLQSVVHYRRERSGQGWEDTQARPHSAWAPAHGPALLQQNEYKIFPCQQAQVGISKFHVEMTLCCTFGEGK